MMLRRGLRWLLLGLGWLFIGSGLAYGGLIGFVTWREQVAPASRRVLLLRDGQRIPLVQPTRAAPVAAVQATGAPPIEPSSPDTLTAVSVSLPPTLPPERIVLPRLALDWPVVLSDNEHLPQFQGVGWLMGSSFPGVPGNMVLFGHLGGPYATFVRLHELQPGDEIQVFTAGQMYRYRVRTSFETTPDDVAVLAPTNTPVATLITCSGPWDPVAQTNQYRLIVIADYLE